MTMSWQTWMRMSTLARQMTSDRELAPRGTQLDDDLYDIVSRSVSLGDVISTLARGHPNTIVSIDRGGIRVSTNRSVARGSGPQLVPAWMIVRAWHYLESQGTITQEGLKFGLGVNRSAFVCALLATFPGVEIESARPGKLRLAREL